MDKSIDGLGEAAALSTLDAYSGYRQIKIDKCDSDETAIPHINAYKYLQEFHLG